MLALGLVGGGVGGGAYKLSANKVPLQMQMPDYEVHQKL